MINVIRTLVPENGLKFEEICSFKTENFVGIWDYISDRFILVETDGTKFSLMTLPACDNLEELDREVYNLCKEHIAGVSDSSAYTITIENNPKKLNYIRHY